MESYQHKLFPQKQAVSPADVIMKAPTRSSTDEVVMSTPGAQVFNEPNTLVELAEQELLKNLAEQLPLLTWFGKVFTKGDKALSQGVVLSAQQRSIFP